ncbi:cobalt-precorrin 5A hydrolase [Oribacterium sp. Sow4_G1_1]|uniref:cobalt-precorrin 5A hydrolase n=1 Tax=Oribacterium sp. Sow4_G1_1 TaxID=3438794 RepID=UPI003F998A78
MNIQMIAFTEKGYRLAEQLRTRWITASDTLGSANAVDQDASRTGGGGQQALWRSDPAVDQDVSRAAVGGQQAAGLSEDLHLSYRGSSKEVSQPPRIELHAKTEALPAISDPRSLQDIVGEWFTKPADDTDGKRVSLSDFEEKPEICALGAGGLEHGFESEKSGACEMDARTRDAGTRHPCDAIIFVGATGIAVRAIAPFICGKAVDPAVLVIDEAGRYVISLLSGHLGGANALARTAASLIEAEPIITTATDAESAFAVDTFAKENGFLLTDLRKAKEVSAKVLRGEKLRIYSDIPMERLVHRPARHEAELVPAQDIDRADIVISYRTKLLNQATGLRLIAKRVHVGLGARKGVTQAEVAAAVATCLEDAGIDPRAVVALASIDLKKQEAGILAYSYESGVPFVTYTAEELRTVEGAFAGSSFVQSVTGVANVCERAAAYAAGRSGHAEVLVHKTIHGSVTTAVAVEA